MRTTRNIDAAGKALVIPISQIDQTVGITVSGTYVGILQIVGIIDIDGREVELIPYNFDGTVTDLEGETPIDFWLDIGGFTQVRVIAVSWTSGVANISAATSAAKRRVINSSPGPGTGTEVQVTNFPAIQNVTGPLTNTQLRASPIQIDLPEDAATEITLAQLLSNSLGFDSNNDPLPINFNYVQSIYTYNNDVIETEIRVVGSATYTRTYTVDFSGTDPLITGVSAWIKS